MQEDFKYLKTIEEMGVENAQLRLNKNILFEENLRLKDENAQLKKELEKNNKEEKEGKK